MLPLLELTSDGKEYALIELREELLPSGGQTLFYSRVSWARTYLVKAGLLEATRRGFVKTTQKGLDILSKGPSKIELTVLRNYPEFLEFKGLLSKNGEKETGIKVVDLLLKMGFGGSRRDAGRAMGRTSDGGMDGIIQLDVQIYKSLSSPAKSKGT